MRIAQMEGLHVQLPHTELGQETVLRCRSIWGTLWLMDRHFSTSMDFQCRRRIGPPPE